MRTKYAVECRFELGEDAEAVWSEIAGWLSSGRLNEEDALRLQVDDRGHASVPSGEAIEWRTIGIENRLVKRLIHRIPTVTGIQLGWETAIWVYSDGPLVGATVRCGPSSRAGVIVEEEAEVHPPRVVGQWIDRLAVVRDGRRLSSRPAAVGQFDVDAFVGLLADPKRSLPVIAVSSVPAAAPQSTAIDAEKLARELAGNAHVFVLDRSASWRLTELLGPRLSTYNGSVRTYWPYFSPDDDPFRHQLLMVERVASDPNRAVRLLSNQIWKAAVDAIGPPPLERMVLAEIGKRDVEDRLGQLSRATDVEAEFLQAYESDLAKMKEQADLIDELQAEIEDLRVALAESEAGLYHDSVEESDSVASVEEAVRLAHSETENVVYLDSAYQSARESQYPSPSRVLADLRALNRVARAWRDGQFTGDFRNAFDAESVQFRTDISDTAKSKYASDYEIEYGGETVLMGPHLRRGHGPIASMLRIYWYVDSANRQLVVGHVGRKLRDDSNRN